MVELALLVLAIVAGSWLLTGVVRRFALARSILDVPNHRSSHEVPTPRGGGLAIATMFLLGVGLLWLRGTLSTDLFAALSGGGLLVAGVGWLDDWRGVPASQRAAVHFLAAGWAVYWLGGVRSFQVGTATLSLGAAGIFVTILGIVWFTNLFNFMDGIDGLAAGQALTTGILAALLLSLSHDRGLAAAALLYAAACVGFLLWNWPPAAIFMGDVGSGLLGYIFAVLGVASESRGSVPLVVWLLLSGVFFFDATVTLVRRVWRGERWYDAHRSHAYQRATQAGWTHRRVTTTVLLLNLALGVLATLAFRAPDRFLPAALVLGALLLTASYAAVERRQPM